MLNRLDLLTILSFSSVRWLLLLLIVYDFTAFYGATGLGQDMGQNFSERALLASSAAAPFALHCQPKHSPHSPLYPPATQQP